MTLGFVFFLCPSLRPHSIRKKIGARVVIFLTIIHAVIVMTRVIVIIVIVLIMIVVMKIIIITIIIMFMKIIEDACGESPPHRRAHEQKNPPDAGGTRVGRRERRPAR